MLIDEYNLNDNSTWAVLPAPYVDPSFDDALIEIAGRNDFGEPMLVRRWGCSYRDPQNADGALKYFLTNTAPTLSGFEYEDNGQAFRVKHLSDVPAHVLIPIPKYESHQLGERRWIIEQYRSAEFLKRSGRYELTHDTGETELRISCKNCGSGNLMLGTVSSKNSVCASSDPYERQCRDCGSRRMSVVDFREIKNERLLNDFPTEGCYDYFLRLQTENGTANGLYRPCDGKALDDIRAQWAHQQKSFGEQEIVRKKRNELNQKEVKRRQSEAWTNA